MLNIIANNINKMQNDLDTMAGESAKYKLYFFVGGAVSAQERSWSEATTEHDRGVEAWEGREPSSQPWR